MLLPPPSVKSYITMQQLLEWQAGAMPWCGSFHGFPPALCPGCQWMAQWKEDQYHWQYYREPSSGPSRTRGVRKTEAPYSNHRTHESSGTVSEDRSTDIDSGYAWIGAKDNTGVGKVWRTPS